MFIETDVSKAASVEALVMSDVKRFGKIDAAFNNTGVLPPTAPLAEQSETDFDRGLNVELKGVFLCMKFQIQAMLQTGGAPSSASAVGVVADPGMAYMAAKYGVVCLSRASAMDYSRAGIRVNALAPGVVATPPSTGSMTPASKRS